MGVGLPNRHRVSITHICVLGHRVQLKKEWALDDLAHLEEGMVGTRVKAHLPPSRHSPPARTCEHVYLLVDVDVGRVRRPTGGIPAQKLQFLEHLFDCGERTRAQGSFFKPPSRNWKRLVYFSTSPLRTQLLAQLTIINPFYLLLSFTVIWGECLNAVSF